MTTTRVISHKIEKRELHALFFLFGFGIMAWVPRFPELKENLNLTAGAFGAILTTGSIGAFLGLLTAGSIVHKIGVYKVGIASTLLLFGSFSAIVHIRTPLYFILMHIAIGYGITAMHVAFNTQGFHVQERSGEIVVTSTAGYWSAGALATAILSGFMVKRVGLALHIGLVSLACARALIVVLNHLRPVLVKANEHPENEYKIRDIFKSFHIDWPLSLPFAAAVYLEFAVGDWGTLFTKERLDIDSGLSAIPYIVFTLFMIFGRLSVQKILHRFHISQVARFSLLLAGTSFIVLISIATHLPPGAKWFSYTLFILAFAAAGLGSAILGPSYVSAGNRRSPHPSAVVVGQLGVVNNLLTTSLKWVVAGIVAATGSIALALMIPAALMIAASFFTDVLKD
jgi:MFS family permease